MVVLPLPQRQERASKITALHLTPQTARKEPKKMLVHMKVLSPQEPTLPLPLGVQRPGRLRWFPHVYWKSDTQGQTQSAPRGVLKFIPTVGCVTCRLDRLPKSWKTATMASVTASCPLTVEASSSGEAWEGAVAAQRVDQGLLRRGGHPAAEIDSLERESSEWRARNTPTLLVAEPPCLSPSKSHR